MRIAIVTLLVACGGKTTDGDTVDASIDTAGIATTDSKPATDTTPDFVACSEPGTCILASKTCCGVCGAPKITDVNAINARHDAAYRSAICPVPEPCPDCPTALEPNLQAFCRGGRCAAVDVRTDALSSCATDTDCMLRYEACCECGASGDFNLIALATKSAADYMRDRCPPMTGCPECAPAYPATIKAVCDAATKHCVVRPT